jgi:hypothetical protein
MGNTNVQESFYSRSLLSGSNFSTETVGQTLTTGHNNYQPPAKIKN